MAERLANRVAVVTGASRGIGTSHRHWRLHESGAHVIAVARTQGGLEELDDEIKALGGSATLVPLDLKDYPAIDRLGAAILERWKKLDILIGNAGMLGKLSPLGHIEPKTWDEVMAVNVTANWRLIRSLDPLLAPRDDGARGLRDLRCGTQVPRLLGRLFGVEGGARGTGQDLRRGDRDDAGARQSVQPRPDAHPNARRGHARRRPLTLPTAEAVAEQLVALCAPDFSDNGTTYRYIEGGPKKVA